MPINNTGATRTIAPAGRTIHSPGQALQQMGHKRLELGMERRKQKQAYRGYAG